MSKSTACLIRVLLFLITVPVHANAPIFRKGVPPYITLKTYEDLARAGSRPIESSSASSKKTGSKEQNSNNPIAVNEKRALDHVRVIVTAEIVYWSIKGEKYDSLTELKNEGLIDETLASGSKDGYKFLLVGAGSSKDFQVVATPQIKGVTGKRSFFCDSTAVIRCTEDGSTPTVSSKPLRKR